VRDGLSIPSGSLACSREISISLRSEHQSVERLTDFKHQALPT
jgi:hypothetical protein